jgi:hypothetical protein
MKNPLSLFSLAIGCLLASPVSFGQKAFTQCSAAFLNTQIVVDEYSPKGQCRLALQSTGELTVQTIALSPTESKALAAIPFKVAIRNGETNTLRLYSSTDVVKVDVKEVLKRCRKGDSLVLMTVSDQYSLPHNEILIQ